MLVAAAVCPCPPVLVPELAAGAAPELDAARAACADALGVLAAARPDLLVVVGPAEQPGRGVFPQGSRGTFRGFGAAVDVRLGSGAVSGSGAAGGRDAAGERNEAGERDAAGERELPPSLTVGAWLLERTGWADAPIEGLGVGESLEAERCLRAGREIAGRAARVAMLVMGDASACRTLKAPGYLDERAAPFDAEVARALGAADIAAIKALDADLAYQLKAAGRAPWQVLAGAAQDTDLAGALLHDDAPYGVCYLVATWS
ncbi:class III extradiol dioxygenase subunit B-like domain-containing protein [Streptomyces sp. NBC_00631]|uniref:class III extradiol dioxygenase subunit B-like domain-containing protein n=1 Tax=Streptomyces sp. NBC_00631 TaxID=2975793 RepID=UPI0030DFDD21